MGTHLNILWDLEKNANQESVRLWKKAQEDGLSPGKLKVLGTLKDGMRGADGIGRRSIAMLIELPDGKVVFAETSLRLLLPALEFLKANDLKEKLESN